MTDYTSAIRSMSVLLARAVVYLSRQRFNETDFERKQRGLIISRYETLSAKQEATALYAVLWYDLMNDAQHLIGGLTPQDTRIGQGHLYVAMAKLRLELEPVFAPIKRIAERAAL